MNNLNSAFEITRRLLWNKVQKTLLLPAAAF